MKPYVKSAMRKLEGIRQETDDQDMMGQDKMVLEREDIDTKGTGRIDHHRTAQGEQEKGGGNKGNAFETKVINMKKMSIEFVNSRREELNGLLRKEHSGK